MGSIRLVVDASSGQVVQRIDYDAFGQVELDTNPGFQPFGFAGGLVDSHSELIRFGARDYDPVSSRWTAKDPLGFAGKASNLYEYSFSDPNNITDPSGMDPLPECLRDFFELLFPRGLLDWVETNAGIPRIVDLISPSDMSAITLGRDIYFREGFNPYSRADVILLGHELVHVYQWNGFNLLFPGLYWHNYKFNRDLGMQPSEAYDNIWFEERAYAFQDFLERFLEESPCTDCPR